MARIYCAGPLFNPPEKQEMTAIAAALEAAGHQTFLPQRDGFELDQVRTQLIRGGLAEAQAGDRVHRAIFCLDVYHLLDWADGVVANLNGRVPDEGTVVEAALAWHAGKALVLYKADGRAPFGGQDNPMLACLADLETTSRPEELPAAMTVQLAAGPGERVERAVELGRLLPQARAGGAEDLARFAAQWPGRLA